MKGQIKILKPLLKGFDKEIAERVLWLREFAWEQCPECNELIYDNYNALAIGWSLSDKVTHNICTIAVYRTNQNVHFGFYWGSALKDPEGLLIGEGSQYRYMLVKGKEGFPKEYMIKLIQGAFVVALTKMKGKESAVRGETILKSVVAKKRK
jgi:hypothetical protein